jgi:hypothetical protein
MLVRHLCGAEMFPRLRRENSFLRLAHPPKDKPPTMWTALDPIRGTGELRYLSRSSRRFTDGITRETNDLVFLWPATRSISSVAYANVGISKRRQLWQVTSKLSFASVRKERARWFWPRALKRCLTVFRTSSRRTSIGRTSVVLELSALDVIRALSPSGRERAHSDHAMVDPPAANPITIVALSATRLSLS